MRTSTLRALLLVGLLTAGLAGCGETMSGDSGSAWAPDAMQSQDLGGWTGGADVPQGPPGAADVYEPPPPEQEIELDAPSVGDRYVFVLNAAREQVIQIDAVTLDIDLVEVGLRPTTLATAPGKDLAVVINAGGDDLSVLRVGADTTTVTNVPSLPGVNRLAMAPDGRHAIAYFDYDARQSGDAVGSLQGVTLVRLEAGEVDSVTVGTGFHPVSIAYADDGNAAFVVSEEGVTRIPLSVSLDAIGVLPTTPVVLDPLASDPLEREVQVTGDGRLAVVRTLGAASMSLVDLSDGTIHDIALPGEPTDLDLAPDSRHALVMMRQEQLATVADLDALMTDPADIGALSEVVLSQPFGAAAISPAGDEALLFTTVDDVEGLGRLDLETLAVRGILLQKRVRAVAFGPEGHRALVLHRDVGGPAYDGMPLEAFVDASPGYSVVDVPAAVARLTLTDFQPGSFAFTAGGERLYVLLPQTGKPDAGGHAVDDVDLATLMSVTRTVASYPEAVQPVPAAGKVAVSQQHPTGRITFFDVATGEGDTITGFELGGLID